MKNIARVADQTAGIYNKFYFTESANLPDNLTVSGAAIIGDIQLKPGKLFNFLEATRFTPDFDQQDDDDSNGTSYSHSFSGFVAGDTPELANAMMEMKGRRFVLLYKDLDGYTKLIGDKEHYLLFDYKLTPGNTPGDRKGYKFSFKGKTALPALFFTGQFEVAEAGIIKPPVTETGAPVLLKDSKGNLLAQIPPGRTLVISSGFKLSYTII